MIFLKLPARSKFYLTLISWILIIGTLTIQDISAKELFPMQQGLHEWNLSNGKMMLIVGTYQDSTTFKRSYSFYFRAKNDDAWNQVPLIKKSDDVAFTWTSTNGADVTLADGIVSFQGSNLYFIQAEKRANAGWHEKGDTTVTWFKFSDSDNEHPDDPPYAFKPIFSRNYTKLTNLKIDDILVKESTLKPTK